MHYMRDGKLKGGSGMEGASEAMGRGRIKELGPCARPFGLRSN